MKQYFKDVNDFFSNASLWGILPKEKANAFISLIMDKTKILKECSIVKMKAYEHSLDTLSVGSRSLRKRIAGQDGNSNAVTAGGRTLQAVSVFSLYEMDDDSILYNIEQNKIVSTLMKGIATQFGNDAEDLGINGDETSADDFIKINNGWWKIAGSVGNKATYSTADQEKYLSVVFPALVNALPQQYKQDKKKLRIYVNVEEEETYRKQMADTSTNYGVAYLFEDKVPTFMGVPVIGLSAVPKHSPLLTLPSNMAYGINVNDIKIDKDKDIRKGSTIFRVDAHIDYEYKDVNAVVIGEPS